MEMDRKFIPEVVEDRNYKCGFGHYIVYTDSMSAIVYNALSDQVEKTYWGQFAKSDAERWAEDTYTRNYA